MNIEIKNARKITYINNIKIYLYYYQNYVM